MAGENVTTTKNFHSAVYDRYFAALAKNHDHCEHDVHFRNGKQQFNRGRETPSVGRKRGTRG